MSTLLFDIETIGDDFDSLDETTQHALTRWIEREAKNDEEYDHALADLKNELGFSPLTGQIVAIGVLDVEKDKGVVYYQSPGATESVEVDNYTLKPATEAEMLEQFWRGALQYTNFVTFNGRSFDVPFLMIRSAVHQVRPTKNLLSNRYLGLQRDGAKHIDLMDQLSFYGAAFRRGSLHLYCRAFGIKSPKADGVTGDEVSTLFKTKKYQDIARYNAGDLRATRELYERWQKFVNV